MTDRNDYRDRAARRDPPDVGDPVDVAPGVPTDRVRWGPILAGTFAALTALAVLSTLGAAIGLTAYDAGDDARRFAIGSGVWGLLTLVLAFGLGGWLAAHSAAVRGHGNGALNGFMVAGVGIPVLLFVLGSAATLLSHAELTRAADRDTAAASANRRTDMATQAGATLGDQGRAPADRREEASRAGRRTAWGALAGLVLAIGAASAAGYVGARDDLHDARRRHGQGGTLAV